MTEIEEAIHARAVLLSVSHRRVENELIGVFIDLDEAKVYRWLDKPSVFMYAVEILGFSESTAYAFTAVAKKCVQIPELRSAIADHRLTVSKASRIVSVLTPENAAQLIAMAMRSSWREIDREVARLSPRSGRRARTRYLDGETVEVTYTLSQQGYVKYKRVEALEAQRGRSGDFHERLYDEYLARHDKVAKADRAMAKKASAQPPVYGPDEADENSVRTEKREPLSAAIQNTVFHRDRGRCTHVDEKGKRCDQDRWIEVHHILPVSEGGTNDPENLTTLCSFHHDMIHQMTFNFDDDDPASLHSPQEPYGL